MVVNFEFLGGEPIENLITCMKFKVDKAVFFGYQEMIDEQGKKTEKFLKKYCGVQTVVFHPLSYNDLQSMLETMRKAVLEETSCSNRIYFDITGGESLILVAFGMLSKEFETPMHMYDIPVDRLIELDDGAKSSISREVTPNDVEMSLKLLVKMHGGKINKKLQKAIKGESDPEFAKDIEKIYLVAKKSGDYWNPFSDFLRNTMVPVDTETLRVSKRAHTVINALADSTTRLKTVGKLNEIVDALSSEGILLDVKHENGLYSFRFKNKAIKDCLWEGGSILELHTFYAESGTCNECQAGVHIDWDGVIHDIPGIDVLNEIDVLSIRGNVPTFISCKSGKLKGSQLLHALYELETVAERFGGKYAGKVLVVAKEPGKVYLERAREMGIEVRVC